MLKALYVVAAASIATAEPAVRFDGHQVMRVVPSTVGATDALKHLGDQFPSLDFWKAPNGVGAAVDVRVAPGETGSEQLLALLRARPAELNSTVMIENVQALIDAETTAMQARRSDRRRQTNDPWTWFYHTYSEIIQHFKEDVVPNHRDIASIVSLGRSYEGRDLMAIRITSAKHAVDVNGSAVANDKPGYFMESLIHAREWIVGATLAWVVEDILENYGKDREITALVDDYDLYFLLVTNPDGYEYTQTNRMWRKTRSPNAQSTCIGTDPNRNWDFHWNEAGTSTNPCADTYGGSGPATESEVVAVQDFIRNHGSIEIFVDFHAYSQLWLTPYGWTSATPPARDYEDQQGCAKAATEALTAVHGTRYTYGPISTTIYPASGSSVDYAYGVCGVPYAFGPEGRDTGRFGFILPSIEIAPSGQENLRAILAMAKYAQQRKK